MVLWVALLVGWAVRVIIWACSVGSNDALLWENFGEMVLHGNLLDTYQVDKQFNHPPLMGYLAMLAYDASHTWGVRFALIFKVVPMAGDLATAVLLRKRAPAHALALTAVLAAAYHGNTDSLAAFFCLLAVTYLDRERPFAGGLALGAALNVKLVAAPLVPILLLWAQRRGRVTAGLALAGLALASLPLIILALLIPVAFRRNILAYNSLPNPWGLVLLAGQGGALPLVRACGKYLVLGAPLLLALRRGWTATRLGAATLLLFLILTPGFSVHYLIYPLPCLLAVSARLGLLYGTVAGVFAFTTYLHYWTGTFPWFSNFAGPPPWPCTLLGFATWLLLFPLLYLVQRPGVDPPGQARASTS